MYSDILALTQVFVRTILPGWDFIGDDLYYYSCAKSTVHKYSLQIQGQPPAALLYFTVWLHILFFFSVIKRGVDLARSLICKYLTWHNQSSAKSPSCSLHVYFQHMLLHRVTYLTVNLHICKHTVLSCPRTLWIGARYKSYRKMLPAE